MHIDRGGKGPDLLLLLHGMGATAAAWSPLCAEAGDRWRGRWLAPDLPGHGRSARLDAYSVGQIAATVARAVLPEVDPAGRLVVLGHSMGGVIGMALATGWFGFAPQQVFGLGIKAVWSDDDLRRMEAIATQPSRLFATEAEAWERYLKVAGLAGLVDAASPAVARGVVQDGEGWRLAMDPRGHAVGKPPLAELMSVARCPVQLGRGSHDPMMTIEQLRALDPEALDLGPHGHNVMVEAPARVWDWVVDSL